MAAAAAGAASGGGGGSGVMAGMAAGGAIAEPIIGAAMQGVQHQWAQQATNDAQNFAQFMANTTYRRAVRDLRLAGLNPALAYVQGGAPSPTVGAADQPNMRFESGAIGRALSNAQQVKSMKSNLQILRNQEDESRGAAAREIAEAERSRVGILTEMGRANAAAEEASVLRGQAELYSAEAAYKRSQKGVAEWESKHLEAKYPYSDAQMRATKQMRDLLSIPGDALRGAVRKGSSTARDLIDKGVTIRDHLRKRARERRERGE